MQDQTVFMEKEINLIVERILGKGSFATVYFCKQPQTQENFAVKVFHKKDFTRNKLHYFRKEAEILQSIEHTNIVKFHSFKETQNSLYLTMEYIPGGTLKELMEKTWLKKKKFTDSEISTIIRSLLEGIRYLHKYNIIHRDLKPGMYFYVADSDDLSSIKIVDFGLSAQLDNNYPKNVKAQCGTLLFMAPQILYQPSYTKSVDLWAVSVIMYLLYNGGQHPIFIKGMKTETYKEKLKRSEFPELPDSFAQNFIKRISRADYNERYSVNEALQHPWITRNFEDQIPLSVNQSIQSFDVSHQISKLMKAAYFVGKVHPYQGKKVSDEYRRKVFQFTKKHEEYRSRSPSFKKITRKTQGIFLKIRSILNHDEITSKSKQENKSPEEQVLTPVIRRHQRLYLKLFEKNKNQQQLFTSNKSNFLLDLCSPIPCKKKEEKIEVKQQYFQGIQKGQNFQQIDNEIKLNFTTRNQENDSLIESEEKPKNIGRRKKVERKEYNQINSSRYNMSRIESKVDSNLTNLRGKIHKKNSFQLAIPSLKNKNTSQNTIERDQLSMKIGLPSPKKPQTPISSKTFINKPRIKHFQNTSKNIYL